MTEAEKLEEIKGKLNDILSRKKDINGLNAADKKYYEDQYNALNKNNGSLNDFEKLQKNINKDLKEASREIYSIRDALAESVNELVGINSGANRAKKAFRGLESLATKLANDQSDISRLSLKELKTIESKVNQRGEELKLAKNAANLQIAQLTREINSGRFSGNQLKAKEKALKKESEALNSINAELSDEGNLRQKIIDQAKARIIAEENIIKVMGTAPAILEGVGKALQKIGLPDFGIAEAVSNTKDILRLKQEEFDFAKNQKAVELDNLKIKKEQLLATIKKNKEEGKSNKKAKKDLKDIQDKIKEVKKQEDGRITSTIAMSELLGQVGKKLKAQFTTANLIQGAFTLLVSSMMQVDKLTGQLAKNIGVSYDESLAMQKNFTQIAIGSDEIMVSTAELNKGFISLNQQFNGATGFSNELVQSFTALTTQAGFTEETIGNIAKITGTQGDDLQDNVGILQGQLDVMNAQEGTSFSTKQVLEGISKVSKATLLTLRNQPRALARTLMTSKKIALSFAEMESIASSLLDFEGSIQNELEAELLTGKNLNLENARQLALKGDIAGAAAEVAKQVGSAAEFEKMNVIQQEAMAKAAGLTREQLANSLIEREALVKLGGKDKTMLEAYNRLKDEGKSQAEIENALGKDRVRNQLKSQSIQERFAASIERLKEIFNDVAQAIMPIASTIADMIVGISKFVAKFSPILKPLLLIYGTFKGIQLLTIGIGKGLKSMANIKKNIVKFSKGEFAFQKKSLATHTRANILKKLGLITDKQSRMAKARATILDKRGVLTQKEKNLYANAGLGTQLKSNIQAKLSNVYEKIKKQFTKDGLVYKGAILAKDLAINAAKLINNNLTAIGLGFNKENLIVKGLIFLKDQAINVAQTIGNGLLSTKLFLQKFLNKEKLIEGVISLRNFAKDAAAALLSVGRLALNAALAVASIPVIGPILAIAAGAAAVAGGMALYNKFKKPAGDMIMADGKTQVSPAEGGLFELSDNDQFVAAPGIADAARASNNAQRKTETVVVNENKTNNSALERSMQKTNKILEIIANKSSTIELAGEKVGAGIAQSEREIQ
jgi:hypothetical protein